MFKNMKPLPKAVILFSVVGLIGFGVSKLMDAGYFAEKRSVAASVPPSIDLPSSNVVASGSTAMSVQRANSNVQLTVAQIPWNATIGLHYANGGVETAGGSLMAKNGVNVKLVRFDEYPKMIAEQVKFANDVKSGKAAPAGAAFAVMMGDGYAGYVAGLNEAVGAEGQFAVIGALGYSRGEDACMMKPEIVANKGRGALIGGVLGDGDINICIKYAADNGTSVNPDVRTFDPNAMNFVATDSFVAADEKLIAGACEERELVENGKKAGKKVKVCVNGTATWTPGDVKIAQKLGGIVKAASTKEYMWQMPAVVIGYKPWMEQNQPVVKAFLAAAFEGGEAVRNNDDALTKGAEVSAKVYNEESAAYWKKYFRGVNEPDAKGQMISLGGSTTNGLADNAYLLGLSGNDNLYKRVYTVFGNINAKYFPDMLKSVPAYDSVVDAKYVEALMSTASSIATPAKPIFSGNATGTEFAGRSYSIEFESGKATFGPGAVRALNELLNELSVSGLTVQINGHTDSVGNPAGNMVLSKARADAVKQFLVTNAGSSFPNERVVTRGFGDSQPVADNATFAGKAKNRRVEVILRRG
jgi:outer membrane protein OmpA-like peptidoglycan-associated protein